MRCLVDSHEHFPDDGTDESFLLAPISYCSRSGSGRGQSSLRFTTTAENIYSKNMHSILYLQ